MPLHHFYFPVSSSLWNQGSSSKEEISPSIDGRATIDLATPDGERGAVVVFIDGDELSIWAPSL
jgi:hypothetical protein